MVDCIWTRHKKFYLVFGGLTLFYLYTILIYQIVKKKCGGFTFFKYLTNWIFSMFLLTTTISIILLFIEDYPVLTDVKSVLAVWGMSNRVIFSFVCLSYYIGMVNLHDEDKAENMWNFVTISKHAIFVFISLLLFLIENRIDFDTRPPSSLDIIIQCIFYGLVPSGVLFLYGIWYLLYYTVIAKGTFIYKYHTWNAVKIIMVFTIPFCIGMNSLFVSIDLWIKNDEYVKWMNAC